MGLEGTSDTAVAACSSVFWASMAAGWAAVNALNCYYQAPARAQALAAAPPELALQNHFLP